MPTRINSRSKGARGEREVAKVFYKWTGRKFAKVPASGGLNWNTSNTKGDIICTKEGHYFPFCIEVKTYKELNFQHLLYLEKAEILKFWAQCTRDAKIAKKIPLLTLRTNGMPKEAYFLVFYTEHLNQLCSIFARRKFKSFLVRCHNITIIYSPEFFELPYKEIRLAAKTILKAQK